MVNLSPICMLRLVRQSHTVPMYTTSAAEHLMAATKMTELDMQVYFHLKAAKLQATVGHTYVSHTCVLLSAVLQTKEKFHVLANLLLLYVVLHQ
jgi:hypothetical protein